MVTKNKKKQSSFLENFSTFVPKTLHAIGSRARSFLSVLSCVVKFKPLK